MPGQAGTRANMGKQRNAYVLAAGLRNMLTVQGVEKADSAETGRVADLW